MKAVEIVAPGGPEALQLTERPDPVAGAGEALIRVAAAGVNRPDVLQRRGLYPVPPGVTDIPGLEDGGHDRRRRSRTRLRRPASRSAIVSARWWPVAVMRNCASRRSASACRSRLRCPTIEAAGLPETYFTVWSNVFDRARLQRGETLLVHGGTSGIGVTAIQLGKAFGATVIVTAGSDDKCDACRALGADHAINYRSSDFVAEARRITNERGVDVILDMVAGDYIARGLQCLAEDGRLVIIAVQGGVKSQIDAGLVLRRRLTITGSTLRPRPVAFKAAIARALREQVWPLLEAGKIRPVVHAVLPAEQAAQAHALMESGTHVGKIVLTW